MAAFPLLPIPPILLEKIISKTEWKSYFRLQQTCHVLEVFTRINQNISVYVDKDACLEGDRALTGQFHLYFVRQRAERGPNGEIQYYFTPRWGKSTDFGYGIRFRKLCFSTKIEPEFNEYVSALKIYRITAEHLDLTSVSQMIPIKLAKEQNIELFEAMKPAGIRLDSIGSNRWEAVLSVRQLKNAYISIDPTDAFNAVQKLLIRCATVQIFVPDSSTTNADNVFSLFTTILQFLRSEELPNLQHFYFEKKWLLTTHRDEVPERLRDFNPIIQEPEGNGMYHVARCTAGQKTVNFIMTFNYVAIKYDTE